VEADGLIRRTRRRRIDIDGSVEKRGVRGFLALGHG